MKNVVLYLLISCLPLIGFSQTETTIKSTDDSWSYIITPDVWMTGLKGDMTVLNQNIPVDLNFSEDILSNLKMAAMVHAEAKKNRLSIMLDIVYAKLGGDGQFKGILNNENDLRIRVKQNVYEAGFGYTFAQSGGFSMDAIAGARYFDLNLNTELNGEDFSSRDFNFVEPYVGMRFQNLWTKWSIGGRFDIGGFGAGSEISYKYNALVGYQFTDLFGLRLGYQAYKPDYQDTNFAYNVASEGFILGFNFNL